MKYSKLLFSFFIWLFILGGSIYGTGAFAETMTNDKTSFEIKPGPLSVQPSHESTQFDYKKGEKKTYANPGSLAITDATGSGNGWHVTVKASPLTEIVTGENEPSILPAGSLVLSLEGAVVKAGEGSGAPPSWIGGSAHIIDGGSPVTLLSANVDEGMGSYLVTFRPDALILKVPEGYLLNDSTYQSVITWSILQGP